MLLALVFVAALGLRAANWWGQREHNPFFATPVMDEQRHDAWARAIAAGRGLGPRPFFRAPLYYYLLAGFYALVGPDVALARLAGCVLGAAACYLIARLGVMLSGFPTGLLAGLLAAVYWPFVYFDGLLLTVVLEVFLNVLLLLLLVRAGRGEGWWRFAVAGAVWGLAALTRPNVLAFAPGVLAWLWWGHVRGARRYDPRRAAGVLFAAAALVILPVTIRNRVVGGEWILIASNGGVNLYIGNNPHADGTTAIVPGTRPDWQGGYEDTHRLAAAALGHEPSEGEVSRYWAGRALAWIRAEPGAWARLMLRKLRLFWSPVEIPNNQPIAYFARLSPISRVYWFGFPVIACLGLAGTVLVGRDWRRWLLPGLYGLLYMSTVVLFFCPGRYRLPVVPVLILLGAEGLVRLVRHARGGRLGPVAGYAAMAGAAALFLATNPPERTAFRRENEGLAHMNLAHYYTNLAAAVDPQRARPHLEAAARLRPEDPAPRLALGTLLLRGGQPAAARPVLEEAVRLNPGDAEGLRHLGYCLEQLGELAAAAEQFRRLLALRPQDADAALHLGTVLGRLGRLDASVEYLQRAVECRPELLSARLNLATTLHRLGRSAEAVAVLEPALAAARRAGDADRARELEARIEYYRRSPE